MPTFKELDDILKDEGLPKDLSRIIYNYTVRDCNERCMCERCWYDAWKNYFNEMPEKIDL